MIWLVSKASEMFSIEIIKLFTGFTLMVSVVVVAHSPASGVKVYVVVARLFGKGDQLPDIPSFDNVGKTPIDSPMQISSLYKAGPFWENALKTIEKEFSQNGIENFRNSELNLEFLTQNKIKLI